MPVSRLSFWTSNRIWLWIVTSSAVVGSSAMIRSGLFRRAVAIATRWRMPPENSCGYCFSRASRRGNADPGQRAGRLFQGLLRAAGAVLLDGLAHLLADGEDRIEGHQRILKDHRDAVAAQIAQALLGGPAQILSLEQDVAGNDLARERRSTGPPRSPVTDLPEPDSPTRPTISPGCTTRSTPSTARPCAGEIVEDGSQPANFEQRGGHRPLTLKLRRRRSPTRLSDMISSTRAMPGKAAIQYSPESRNSNPLAIRSPREGWVTGTPTPRKDRVASSVIAPRDADRRDDEDGADGVRQEMCQHDVARRQAEIDRRLDIFLAPLDKGRRAHQAGILRPLHQDDGDDHLVDASPDGGEQHEGDQDRRETEHEVHDAHDRRIDGPAELGRDEAGENPDGERARGGRQADQQAGAETVQDRAEHVAALRVGSEPVSDAGHALRCRAPGGCPSRSSDARSCGFCGAMKGARRARSRRIPRRMTAAPCRGAAFDPAQNLVAQRRIGLGHHGRCRRFGSRHAISPVSFTRGSSAA